MNILMYIMNIHFKNEYMHFYPRYMRHKGINAEIIGKYGVFRRGNIKNPLYSNNFKNLEYLFKKDLIFSKCGV